MGGRLIRVINHLGLPRTEGFAEHRTFRPNAGKVEANRSESVALGLEESGSPPQDPHPKHVEGQSTRQARHCACHLK